MIPQLAFAPDGQTLASAGVDGTVRLWPVHPPTSKPDSAPLPADRMDYFRRFALSPDARTLLWVSTNSAIEVWDTATLRPFQRLPLTAGERFIRNRAEYYAEVTSKPGTRRFDSFGIDSARARLVLGTVDGPAWLRWLDGHAPDVLLAGHTNMVNCATFCPDGHRVATASLDGTVRIWAVDSGRELSRLAVVKDTTTMRLVYSPDGTRLAAADHSGDVRVWDITGHQPARLLHGHRVEVHGLAFSPDNATLATSGVDSALRLWNLAAGTVVAESYGYYGCLAFSPDGARLAAGGFLEIRLWDTATWQPVGVLKGHTDRIWALGFLHGNDDLVSAGPDSLHLWRPISLSPTQPALSP